MFTSRASSSLTTRSVKEFFVLNDDSEGRFLKLIRNRILKYASIKHNRVELMFEGLHVDIIFSKRKKEIRGRVSVIRENESFAVDPILIIGGGRFMLDLLGEHDESYNEVSIDVYDCQEKIYVDARSM